MAEITLAKTRTILCEGPADKEFLERLIAQRNLPDFDVLEVRGKDRFGRFLFGLATNEGISRVAGILIVSDCDDSAAARFKEIRTQIQEANRLLEGSSESGRYGVPDQPLTVARSTEHLPAVVVLMVPWAGEAGNLETLCVSAIYELRPELRQCVDDYSDCTKTASTWGLGALSKMRLQCLIAVTCKTDPNKALRYVWSVDECPIRLDSASFDRLAQFLQEFDAHLSLT